MPVYESAGLYPEERKASAGPVAAVSTSTYASAGWLRKGPVNQAQLVIGFDNFVEQFGSYWRNSFVPFMVEAFFNNDGARAYITRVVPADATKAANASCLDSAATSATFYTRKLTDPVTTLDATHYNIKVQVDPTGTPTEIDVTGDSGVAGSYALSALVTNIDTALGALTPPGSCVLEATLGGGSRLKMTSDSSGETSTLTFSAPAANDCSKELLGLDVSGGSYSYAGEDAIDWSLEAAWEGAWYNQVRMCISGNQDYPDGNGGWTAFNVENQEESELGEADWDVKESFEAVEFTDDTSDQFAPTVINDQTNYCKITEGADFAIPRELQSYARSNECLGEGDGAVVTFSGVLLFPEVFEDSLSIVADTITATDDGDGNLTGTGVNSGTIDYETGAWTITYDVAPAAGVLIMAAYDTVPAATEVCCQLTGGTDGTGPITRALISQASLEADKEGIYAFNAVDEILNMDLPDFSGDTSVQGDLIAYCENRKDRFAILGTAESLTPSAAKKWIQKTAQYNTSYAALYYPWVTIADPLTTDSRPLNVPPGGFIAGVFARTDNQRNVGKAPAGINDGKLLGCIGLERVLEKGERDILYPVRINPLVASAQTGRAVWGQKTLSLDAEWGRVQARRLFIFLEKSIENASYWVVFENNGPPTWSRMLSQGNGFFSTLFRDGYFKGTTPSEAFKIVIDETNNTPDVIDQHILIADYYAAPNKAGEFIRLRFQQKLQSA